MPIDVQERAFVEGIVDAHEGDRLVLRIPGTDYRLHLRTAPDAGPFVTGQRVRGSITARALRLHPASGGGRFVEPVIGEPRIVAGSVLAVDRDHGRVLVSAAVPIWLETAEGQDFDVLTNGGLVNGHVRSGTTFEAAAGPGRS